MGWRREPETLPGAEEESGSKGRKRAALSSCSLCFGERLPNTVWILNRPVMWAPLLKEEEEKGGDLRFRILTLSRSGDARCAIISVPTWHIPSQGQIIYCPPPNPPLVRKSSSTPSNLFVSLHLAQEHCSIDSKNDVLCVERKSSTHPGRHSRLPQYNPRQRELSLCQNTLATPALHSVTPGCP